ncbi:transient receptor potential cation channel subfamily M member 6-like [Stylophora pistillata]|uniref:transient receptor potential cation channel subfamily M member 6-like n=1 Tax=Stylophora pistillata TaxID=50429 RepID=UPI000C039957|nr:transient receptor potential cation channel subfamily M member 6-like [Stylophora pistillata]
MALQDIQDTEQTPEEHTRKVVQGHTLAFNFARQLRERVIQEQVDGEYGQVLEYRKIFMGKTDIDEFLTVEEYTEGDFVKYISNNDQLCGKDSEISNKAEANHKKSKGKLMLLDIQGSGHTFYDPEIASRQIMDEHGKVQFCTGNLSIAAIDNFFFKS